MPNAQPPKHKPNEKHTLDEVLKSLNDLVRGNVLDKPAAPPAPTARKPAAPPPLTDMGDILRSLESLLDNDLNPNAKPTAAKPAPPAASPKAKQPKPEESIAKPPTPKPHAPVEPSSAMSDVLSEADLVKVLEEISFDTDFSSESKNSEPKLEAEPEFEAIDAAPMAELDSIVFDETPAIEPEPVAEPVAPTPEISEPVSLAIESGLSLDVSDAGDGLGPIEDEVQATVPPDGTGGLEFTEDEISAAPPPDGGLEFTEDETIVVPASADDGGLEIAEEVKPSTPSVTSLVDELASIDFAVDDLEPARTAPRDDFSIDFTPSKRPEPEPPVVEPETSVTEEIEAAAATAPVEEIDASPTIEEIAVEAAAAEAVETIESIESIETIEPEPESPTPPPPMDDTSDIIERAEPPTVSVSGGKHLGQLGEFMELDISESDTTEIGSAELIELGSEPEPEPAPPALAAEAEPPPKQDSTTVELDEPVPAPVSEKEKSVDAEPKEIPVLNNVAIAPTIEDFALELSPPIKPTEKKPVAAKKAELDAQDLHQTAVRVIAKLNIELRKSGKPPLDAKAINRLQQLLKEALENRKK